MRAPFRDKPLKNPGQSLDNRLFDVFYDEVLTYGLLATVLVALAGMEWWRWYADAPPAPRTMTVIAAIAVAVAVWKIRRALPALKNLRLGRDGERFVGQFLEQLRANGARVLHDIPGDGFNLDHVLIHTTGLYVIETKTMSKPDRGETKLVYDGQSITKNGLKPERDPIAQVRAGSSWLADLVKNSTGRSFPVRGVVIYPGWYIEATPGAKSSDVWVLNEKALPAFIANSRECVAAEDVALCAFHLERYVLAS